MSTMHASSKSLKMISELETIIRNYVDTLKTNYNLNQLYSIFQSLNNDIFERVCHRETSFDVVVSGFYLSSIRQSFGCFAEHFKSNEALSRRLLSSQNFDPYNAVSKKQHFTNEASRLASLNHKLVFSDLDQRENQFETMFWTLYSLKYDPFMADKQLQSLVFNAVIGVFSEGGKLILPERLVNPNLKLVLGTMSSVLVDVYGDKVSSIEKMERVIDNLNSQLALKV